jgi:hypothetical protein
MSMLTTHPLHNKVTLLRAPMAVAGWYNFNPRTRELGCAPGVSMSRYPLTGGTAFVFRRGSVILALAKTAKGTRIMPRETVVELARAAVQAQRTVVSAPAEVVNEEYRAPDPDCVEIARLSEVRSKGVTGSARSANTKALRAIARRRTDLAHLIDC